MQSNRGRDTYPELAIRREVHRRGFRYRVDYKLPLPGVRRRADLAFTRTKVAVFVDGCFWHGCPEHFTVARTNAVYWAEKVQTNRERDRDTDNRLVEAGWNVVRVWEHEDPIEATARIAEALRISA